MEIIVGLLILGVVLFAIQKKVSKTTPIVEEIKEEVEVKSRLITVEEEDYEPETTEEASFRKTTEISDYS